MDTVRYYETLGIKLDRKSKNANLAKGGVYKELTFEFKDQPLMGIVVISHALCIGLFYITIMVYTNSQVNTKLVNLSVSDYEQGRRRFFY